ncbi:hypothetical protein ROS217_03645 [Roseovarius sp. 217]|nr:hypothetical protein ROS217_03645 [Roseovarius sp. 217]
MVKDTIGADISKDHLDARRLIDVEPKGRGHDR